METTTFRVAAAFAAAIVSSGIGAALQATQSSAAPPTPPPVTVSPLPGTPDASPSTQVSFLGARASRLSHVVVTGSLSGTHRGTLKPYATGTGASFIPAAPFSAGETVTVRATETVGARSATVRTRFTVATLVPLTPEALPVFPAGGAVVTVSRPDLQPPPVTVTVPTADRNGDLFLTPAYGSQSGPMVVSPTGRLVWFSPEPANTVAANLQVQRYLGRRVLTYWQGGIALGHGLGEGVILDAGYRRLATVRAGNGLVMDMHDFTLGPDGVAYITIYDPLRADLTPYGGPANGIIDDSVVQEIDVRTGLVMFEWHALGHVPVTDSHVAPTPDPSAVYDWFHVNRVQRLRNGDLLVNSRQTWAAYRISHRTGRVLWQIGGKHTTFALDPSAAFAYQHDTTLLPNGTVAIFDNEDNGQTATASVSRGLIFKLNFATHVATLTHAYVDARTPILTPAQGSIQHLHDGDWLLGYGLVGLVAQFSPAGRLTFELTLAPQVSSYRAFRFAWTATPAGTRPTLVASRTPGANTTAIAVSWNGATTVRRWQVLAGTSATALRPIAVPVPETGFETRLTTTTTAPYVAVRAIDANGRALATSPAVAVTAAG
jgi:Arylsulfotransferase (ASST)